MTTVQSIAAKFNVLESAIVRIEEWASVLFCFETILTGTVAPLERLKKWLYY